MPPCFCLDQELGGLALRGLAARASCTKGALGGLNGLEPLVVRTLVGTASFERDEWTVCRGGSAEKLTRGLEETMDVRLTDEPKLGLEDCRGRG